jgi:hypothetical protein
MSGWGEAVAKVAQIILALMGRRAAHNDKPETQNANRRAEVEKEILNDDEAAANARVADDLFRLRMQRNAQAKDHLSRPGDQTREG